MKARHPNGIARRTAIALASAVIAAACSTTPIAPFAARDAEANVLIPGFDFTLHEGDFWQYGWRCEQTFPGGRHTSRKDYFTVTLGAETVIQDVAAFPLLFSGTPAYTPYDELFVKRHWTHIALADNVLYGSPNGRDLQMIFNARSGVMPGYGFFRGLGRYLYDASRGAISNEFISDNDVWIVRQSTNPSQCDEYPAIGTICGNSDTIMPATEYYKELVGPVGYHTHLGRSSEDGSLSTDEDVGLLSASRTVDGPAIASGLDDIPLWR